MKATLFSSSISANLGNSGEAMVENSQKVFSETFVLFAQAPDEGN